MCEDNEMGRFPKNPTIDQLAQIAEEAKYLNERQAALIRNFKRIVKTLKEENKGVDQ